MPFSVTGYVLEPTRVGQANSPFTFTPNIFVANQVAFDTAYPSDESVPPTQYLVQVMQDGDLADAVFGWSRNEVIQRFDYDGRDQRFKTLPGSGVEVLGQLGPTSNTTRLKATKPLSTSLATYPIRVSVGTGSGTTFTVSLVLNDGSFGSPVSGTVELSRSTGNLNWNTSDLTTYGGQDVRFQRQTFFTFDESNGRLGLIDDPLLLNPLPATGQYPLVRIGFGEYLTPIEVPNDAGLLPLPASGSFKWSVATGRLAFNAVDVSSNTGRYVYYDGVLIVGTSTLTPVAVGTLTASGVVFPLPPEESDTFFRATLTSGGTANITSVVSGEVTITGLSSITPSLVGRQITVSGASNPNNNGSFLISEYISATSLKCINALGVAPDTNNGSISWAIYVQFPQTKFVDALSTSGERGVVEIRRSDGQVRFSAVDQTVYGAAIAWAIIPNLSIERGMSLMLFRSPIDPSATDPALKDVSALYTTTSAILADPIVAAPQVFLPAVPVDTMALAIRVIDQTGTTQTLPRMDVPSPPVGIGYVLDSEARTLLYAQRKSLVVVPAPVPYGAVQLPDPLVFTSSLVLELESPPNSASYVPLILGEDALLDTGSGAVSLVETDGTLVASGAGGAFLAASTAFSDAGQNFVAAGVLSGDLLLVQNGTSIGVYTVASVGGPTTLTTDVPTESLVNESSLVYEIRRGEEILADRFFKPISPLDPNTKVERIVGLGTTTNSPRFSVPLNFASSAKSRFRFGPSTFSTVVSVVSVFTAPGLLPQGTVEILDTTGELNFSSVDVTAALTVYWVRTLTLGADYKLQPPLGFIQFNERFLALEEALITYKNSSDLNTVIEEPATFLVRKEITQPHPTPTNVLSFNPLGRTVTLNPPPRVFRGGRPQVTNEQVSINSVTSTITFNSDQTITDALPHGAVVGPTERVYIDYYITQAIGGESSVTVIQPPMAAGVIQSYLGPVLPANLQGNGIVSGSDRFTIPGDRTADFLTNCLLRVTSDYQEAYLLDSSTYDVGSDTTTVLLASPQEFLSDVSVPNLFVTSGPTRPTAAFLQPSYFVTELTPFYAIPRGSSRVRFIGDVSTIYTVGKIIHFTDGGSTFRDFYQVNGSSFDETTGLTEVVLTSNTAREYPTTTIVKRSVRNILEASTKIAQTSRSPILTLPYTVFRRVSGQVGEILSQPSGFQITDAGSVTFATVLQDDEAWSILYTGYTIAQAGQSLRASYTFQIIPTEANGLLGSTLVADYTTYVPDSFFWRVETFTQFRGELAAQYVLDAQASIPSGGPTLSNLSSPELHEQGRESLFFQEKHLANEDIVARATLKFYNDAINYLEDVLQDMDGRVIGDRDGRFLFDGLIDNPDRTTFASVTNQIDDRFKISPAPYAVSFPPFSVTSIGTYQAVYLPAKASRFFSTQRRRYNVTVGPAGLEDGDSILDTRSKELTVVSKVQRRSPWAMMVRPASAADTTIYVDFVAGDEDLLRTAFVATMKVRIADTSTVYTASLTILSVASGPTPQTITFTTPVGVSIPRGATVYLSTSDTTYRKFYRVGTDVGVDAKDGQLTHISPFPPLDGSVPAIDPALYVQNPAAGEVLDLIAQLNPLNVAPDRFPALDGLTTDDDGDRQLPLLNPFLDSEAPNLNGTTLGHLGIEQSIIQPATGTLRLATTVPYLDTGSLDGTGTILTASLVFPATVKPYDLVRILTGANALSSYRRILTVVGNVITVTPAFTTDAGFSFTVTASASLVTSTADVTSTTSTLDDTSGPNFLTAGVLPGHTVVLTTGPSAGERRQVLTVAATSLSVSPAFSTSLSLQSYRVDDALTTFGGTGSIQAQLVSELADELGVLDTNTIPLAEREAIEQFYDTVFTDIETGTTGATTIGLPTFTDLLADFSAVTPEDFVYIRSGSVAGVYKVQTVTSTTTLDIETTFPATAAGVSYRIVSATGTTKLTLQNLFPILQAIDTFIATTTTFQTLVTTPVTVAPDASAFARGWLTADLDARSTLVGLRISNLSTAGSVGTIQSILSSGDRLYDQRYVWIDARINRETGILVKQTRATESRIQAQEDILKQLTKLLTA